MPYVKFWAAVLAVDFVLFSALCFWVSVYFKHFEPLT